ncbi:MAG: hypothetical protein QOI62_1852 [Solirubrobacteraceae bacterium]|jgi:uncharacterized protein YkwD|nr:hypothetical protein [Solirubrobacteraceae bacterium]
MSRPRLLWAAALFSAALLGPATAAAARCSGATARPTAATLARQAAATLCLVNDARAAHGLAPLRAVPALARAARAHAQEMVRADVFSHTGIDGSTPSQRITRTGYLGGASSWKVGETIAWGSGRQAAPAAIVRGWLRSAEHRAILLDGRYRDLGVGIALGAPGLSGSAATVTADLGARR